ncbi:MAG: Calx-beta domain-containing protein [Cyanobacteriota bacterium]
MAAIPVVIDLSVLPALVTEDGSVNLLYTFKRSGPLLRPLTVSYTVGGTASLGSDYTGIAASPATKSVTFAAGADTTTVTVNPTADTICEADETVILTLAPRTGYTIGTTTGVTGTLANDDLPLITLAVSPTAVTEDGTSNLVYSFKRTGPTANALSVDYIVGGTAELGTDYTGIAATPANKTITFAAGSSTATVTVDPKADTLFEADETVILTLKASTLYSIGTTAGVTGTIRNDDRPSITLAVSPAAVTENGTANLRYTFKRSGPTTKALNVNYTVGGTAELGTDYTGIAATPANKTISFAAGSDTATVFVDPTGDSLIEANETVILTLKSGTAYTIGTSQGVTGTITNDDFPRVTLAVSPAAVSEDGATNLTYTFTRTGSTASDLTVNYRVGGTATIGSDYTGIAAAPATKTVTFTAGSNTATVTVDPTVDRVAEAHETVVLTLASGSGYTVGTTTGVSGTIRNDDLPSITLAVASASVAENGTDPLLYTFRRTGATTSALSVNYTLGGTATLSTDYIGIPLAGVTKTISFAPGSDSATVTVDPTGDDVPETDETVILTLASGKGYTIDTTTAVSGTIQDDEPRLTLLPASGSIQEGEILTVAIPRTGEREGTSFYWELAGTGISEADVPRVAPPNMPLKGVAKVASDGSLSVFHAFLNDLTTEGNETLTINLYRDAARTIPFCLPASITLVDSSITPAAPTGTTTIKQTTSISSSIARGGEVDSYALDVAPGSIISASLTSNNPSLYPLIQLNSVTGSILKDPVAYNGNSTELGMVDMITGKATITVKTQVGGTGDYKLNIAVFTASDYQNEVIRLTNLERIKAGLTPFTPNRLLTQAAEGHVQDMDAKNSYLGHSGSNGSSPMDRIKATGYAAAWQAMGDGRLYGISLENSAGGQRSPVEVVADWMNSVGHRKGILDPAAKEIGVGFQYDHETQQTYWVQNFGNPWTFGLNQWF